MSNRKKINNGEIIIREVSNEDSSALVNLMAQLGYALSEEEAEKRIRLYLNEPRYKALVATLNGSIVGTIEIIINDCFHRAERFCFVDALVIEEQQRKKGLGKALLSAAEKIAKENHCSSVELNSGNHREEMGAHAFYKHMGYNELNDSKKFFVKSLNA